MYFSVFYDIFVKLNGVLTGILAEMSEMTRKVVKLGNFTTFLTFLWARQATEAFGLINH